MSKEEADKEFKMLIQLQRLDADGVNQGGLYLNVNHISAIYFNRHVKNLPDGVRGRCVVVMQSGVEYTVAQSTSEVTNEVAQAQRELRNPRPQVGEI